MSTRINDVSLSVRFESIVGQLEKVGLAYTATIDEYFSQQEERVQACLQVISVNILFTETCKIGPIWYYTH